MRALLDRQGLLTPSVPPRTSDCPSASPGRYGGRRWVLSSHPVNGASWRNAARGQSGQRRTFAQHGASGLRAVAGAASATSAAAGSPPRKRTSRRRWGRPRPGRGMSPLRSQAPRCPMEQRRLKISSASRSSVCLASLRAAWRCASFRLVARRWPVLRNRGGRPAARGSRPPRAMIARGRAGAPRRVRAIAQARRASGQARP